MNLKPRYCLCAALLLLQPTAARADVNLKRVMFLSPSSWGSPNSAYNPVMDMDHDGRLEMAYETGRIDSNATNPWRWEYGRFLPFNRWRLLYADTLLWPPPNGFAPASFSPFAMGDADHDGLNEIWGTCASYFGSGGSDDSMFFCTMEQRSPTGPPDTITWFRFCTVNALPEPTLQLAGSLDGDSLDDILVWTTATDSLRGHYMLENRGDNSYVRTWTPGGRVFVSTSLAYGDCDRDGRVEFMGADVSGGGKVSFWETAGDDQYACTFVDTTPVPNPGHDCFFGRDVNQNGRPEFFMTCSRYVGGGDRFYLYMWESDADNHYVRTLVDSVGSEFTGCRSMCGDVDGDGVDEVVWNTIESIRIYETSAGQPLRCVGSWLNDHDPSHQFGANVNIADVNYDGYGEILFACRSKLSVLEVEAIRVLVPNARVEYNPGDTCRISWETFDPPRCDSVSLFLRTDTTYALDTIARGLAPDDTPYVWVVPDIQADSARIMAIAYGPGWQFDESDNAFRIAPVGMTGPRIAPPREWALSVSPNPARGALVVRYDVPRQCRVSVGVYDVGGRLVEMLAEGMAEAGRHRATPSVQVPAGVYFCTLDNGSKRISRKLVLTE